MFDSVPEFDLLLKHPFNMVVSGSSGSGKSEWVARLIEKREQMIDTKFTRVVYHYGIFTKKILDFQKAGIETYHGMPREEDYFKSDNPTTLLILDDLLTEASENFLKILFTKATHHCNISAIFITQSFFDKSSRICRTNGHYFCFMRNPSSVLHIRNFATQVFPRKVKEFMEAYEDSTSQAFGYLFLDLHAQSPPLLKLRTRIFETPSFVYSI